MSGEMQGPLEAAALPQTAGVLNLILYFGFRTSRQLKQQSSTKKIMQDLIYNLLLSPASLKNSAKHLNSGVTPGDRDSGV